MVPISKKACLCFASKLSSGSIKDNTAFMLFSLQMERIISIYPSSSILGTIKYLSASYNAGASLLQSVAIT